MWSPTPARATATESTATAKAAESTATAKTTATETATTPPTSVPAVGLRHRHRPQQVQTAATATSTTSPAQSGENEEDDEQQEDERAKRGGYCDRAGRRFAILDSRHRSAVESDVELARESIGDLGDNEKKPAAVVALNEIRRGGASNVPRDAVGDEPLHPSSSRYADSSLTIAGCFLRNEKDYDAGIFGRITGTRCRAHAPLSADPEGDVSHVAASQIPHRDDGDLATGFRANFKRDPVDPVDDRLIENAGSVYDDFSRRGAVSPRRSRNLDLLIGSEKKGKEKGQFSSRTGDGDRK